MPRHVPAHDTVSVAGGCGSSARLALGSPSAWRPIYKHSAVACGAATAEAGRAVTADLFLLGVTGVHPEHGLTTGDAEEAAMKRTLGAQAAETFVLASAEKIGAVSAYKMLDLSATAAIVTDAVDDALEALRGAAPAIIKCN